MSEIVYLDDELKGFFEGTKSGRAICRYIPPKNLTKERFSNIWFSNPKVWKDPFESLFIDASYKLNGEKGVKFRLKDRVYCLCIASDRRCEAAWKIYKCDTQFVIKKDKLIKILKANSSKYDVYIGKIRYRDESVLCTASYETLLNEKFTSDDTSWVRLLFLKRFNYKYEEEIRIVLVAKKPNKDRRGVSLSIKCPLSDFYRLVILRPNISSKKEQEVRAQLTKNLKIPAERIRKDSLYDDMKKRRSQNMNLDYKKKPMKKKRG